MTVLLAVLAVGAGSLLFRAAPLLGARHLPDGVVTACGWAGVAVITAITVRAVLDHDDPATPLAPVAAALAVATGLAIAVRGVPVLWAVAGGAASYLVLVSLLAAP